jgi:hypothetical protein
MHTLLMLWVAAVPVSGQVVDTEGKPVPNATVTLSEPITQTLHMDGRCTSEGRSVTVNADSSGRFSASPDFEVSSGVAEAPDYVRVEREYGNRWTQVHGRRSIILKLRKDPFVELSGTVIDQANAPLEGARVSANSANKEAAFSDASGNFKLQVRSSETKIWVYKKGFEQAYPAREKSPMKITMVRRPTMAVYLVNASKEPIAGFTTVTALDAHGKYVGSCTTRYVEGDCTLEGQLGEITVTAKINDKTVTQKVTLKDTQKIDVTLLF